MALVFHIPDEILQSIKLPEDQIEKEIQKEFAFFLYAKGFLSMGNARKLSGLTKHQFIEGLAQRDIPRHYNEKDCEEDIQYAKGR